MKPIRPRQEVPKDIVGDLMDAIRGQFYGDQEAKRWFQDRNFLLRRVVLWPAGWLTSRGVTLQPERYKAIILEVFNEIKIHGTTGAVKFWPGYLAKCIQERFNHNEEKIYEEAKATRTAVENALLACRRAKDERGADPVESMAQVKQVLDVRQKRRKTATNSTSQLSLL